MNKKLMNKMSAILKRAQTLRQKQTALEVQLENIKANLADAQVEYVDLQKTISDDLFNQSNDIAASVQAHRPKKKKAASKRKTWPKAKRKKGNVKRKGEVKGTRAQIQAAAKARDEGLLKVLGKSKKPMNVEELWRAVNNGSLEQMRTSLKRNRKKLKTVGYAKNTKYSLKGKK